ncbi:MAG: TonB-dependent receptor plug domain-containing protein, partial [Gemmatimonadaceae bacterium]
MTKALALVTSAMLALGSSAHAQIRAELRGHVTEARTARPIADARIEIVGRTEATRTDADGAFVLRGLEPRTYTVRVRALGFAAHDADVDVTNGRAALLEVELEPSAASLSPVVVNASRLEPGATTFDRQAIEASGRRDVGELLSAVPGLVITQAGGPGSPSHVSIRGSGSNEVLVLVDGAPLNSTITGDADLSRLSLESVDRVVVHTGAQSARYGGRAMAGVIEVDTRRPVGDASLVARTGAWGEGSASMSAGDTRPLADLRAGASLTAEYRT